MTDPQAPSRLTSIEAFEIALRSLLVEYLRTLSPNAPTAIDRVRVEVSGAGVSMTYDNVGRGDEAPTLVVSLTPGKPEGH